MKPLPFSISDRTLRLLTGNADSGSSPTIGQLADFYCSLPCGNRKTRRINALSLYRVIRDSVVRLENQRVRPGMPRDQEAIRVIKDLSASILTGRLLDEFYSITDEKTEAGEEQTSSHKTLVGLIASARAIFTLPFQSRIKQRFGFAPAQSFFVRPFRRRREVYDAPRSHIIQNLHRALRLLWPSGADQNLCIMVLLGLWAGLRPEEMLYARRRWLDSAGPEPCIIVQAEWDFVPKRGAGRIVPIPRWLYDLLQKICIGEYLLRGDDKERIERARERCARWLRQCGLNSHNVVYEMRKLYACSEAAKRTPPEKLRKAMGHADAALTWFYYVGYGFWAKADRLAWDEPLALSAAG